MGQRGDRQGPGKNKEDNRDIAVPAAKKGAEAERLTEYALLVK